MRRKVLQQAELGEVALPKLGPRAVVQLIEASSRGNREMEARGRLDEFRGLARNRAPNRLLRQARRSFDPHRVGSAVFFDLTGRDADAYREAAIRVGRKFGKLEASFLLVDEQTRLADAKGHIKFIPEPWDPAGRWAWIDHGGNFAVIFMPEAFGDEESFATDRGESPGVTHENLTGRSNFLPFLVARAFTRLSARRDPQKINRRLKKWGLCGPRSFEQYASRLVDVMRTQ